MTLIPEDGILAVSLLGLFKCEEMEDETECGKPATYLVGFGDDHYYKACDRCAQYWADNCRYSLDDVRLTSVHANAV